MDFSGKTMICLILQTRMLRYFAQSKKDTLVGTPHTGDISHAGGRDVDVQDGVIFVNEAHSHVH
jgi:hypothetical protein